MTNPLSIDTKKVRIFRVAVFGGHFEFCADNKELAADHAEQLAQDPHFGHRLKGLPGQRWVRFNRWATEGDCMGFVPDACARRRVA